MYLRPFTTAHPVIEVKAKFIPLYTRFSQDPVIWDWRGFWLKNIWKILNFVVGQT